MILNDQFVIEKYSTSELLALSAGRGWLGLSAELRSHRKGVIAWESPLPDTEICVGIRGSRSVITRRSGAGYDRTVAERGTVWICPAGVQGNFIDISDPVPEILHISCPRAISRRTF